MQQIQKLTELQSKKLFYLKKHENFMGSLRVKFNVKKYHQEFQVLKYIRTMSSHHLTATITLICKRFGLDERIVEKYVTFLINMGEIVELQKNDERNFVTHRWFFTKI